MLNRVFIIGKLTRDPTIRPLPSGSQVVDFVVVHTRRYSVDNVWKEENHFFEVKAYGALADRIGGQIGKGYTVLIEGRLIQERWTDKSGNSQSRVRILADSVKVLDRPKIQEEHEELQSEAIEESSEEYTDEPFDSKDDEMRLD